jgi:hypothetical protein
MSDISFKNSIKNLDRYRIRTHTYLIRRKDKQCSMHSKSLWSGLLNFFWGEGPLHFCKKDLDLNCSHRQLSFLLTFGSLSLYSLYWPHMQICSFHCFYFLLVLKHVFKIPWCGWVSIIFFKRSRHYILLDQK